MGEYGIPGLTGISNWLDELLSRYVGYDSHDLCLIFLLFSFAYIHLSALP